MFHTPYCMQPQMKSTSCLEAYSVNMVHTLVCIKQSCVETHGVSTVPNRLLGMDDSSFQALAAQCPGLQHLCIGFEGSDESIYHPDDYYCSVISDAALIEIAHNCHQLK